MREPEVILKCILVFSTVASVNKYADEMMTSNINLFKSDVVQQLQSIKFKPIRPQRALVSSESKDIHDIFTFKSIRVD